MYRNSLKSLYFAATFSALLLHNCLMSFSWRILPLLIPLWHVPYSLKSLLYFAAIYFALLLHNCLMSFSQRILPLLIPLWHVPYSLKSLLYFAAIYSALCHSHRGCYHCWFLCGMYRTAWKACTLPPLLLLCCWGFGCFMISHLISWSIFFFLRSHMCFESSGSVSYFCFSSSQFSVRLRNQDLWFSSDAWFCQMKATMKWRHDSNLPVSRLYSEENHNHSYIMSKCLL